MPLYYGTLYLLAHRGHIFASVDALHSLLSSVQRLLLTSTKMHEGYRI